MGFMSFFARQYARIAPAMDARGAAAHRAELVVGRSGAVIEIGCGPGGMFAHYPEAVTSVLAVEPDPYLRGMAKRAAASAPVPVRVVAGSADALPAADSSLDAAVFSLVLCSVPEVAAALSEVRRVLKPGGQLRFYEHVRSASRLLGLLESAVTPFWKRLAGGCHLNRDTPELIEQAGFTITSLRRFGFAPIRPGPALAHVIGSTTIG